MNSVFQALLHAPPLRNYFLGDRHNRFLCSRRTPIRHKRKETGAEEEEKGTCNELAKELGGYKHVTVTHDIKVVDEGTAQALQNLPLGSAPVLDSIVVGLDMVMRKFGNTKGKRRLCLITSAQDLLRDPPEGTKEEQMDTIADMLKKHSIKLECIIFREPGVHHNAVMEENDRLLYQFRNRSVAKVVQVDSPTSLLGALKTRNVLPVTVFRGDLEVNSNFKIKVWVYKKAAEEKFPTSKKYSDKAPPSDKFASYEVKVDYEYKSVVEPDKVVPPDQRIKGYLYGPQVVPVSNAEWEAVKFKPEKGVKLLGFTDRSNVPRQHFMKDVCLFIPEPGNIKATLAVSAIARAMHQMNKQDSFYFNVLPFAEDIREFQFRSFSSMPSSSQPTEEQQEAADNLVKMLDLAPPGREVLKPEFTPNPMLERFCSYLDLKSKQPDANVPPLERSLRRITEPDPDVIGQQTQLIQNLGKAFELKENPKKKKARTKDILAYSGAGDQAKSVEEPSVEKDRLLENTHPPTENVGAIRDSNPVQDFVAMLAKRSSSTWVQKAIEDMQNYTAALLQKSRDGSNYQKALEYFAAPRKACIIEQEPQEFNEFLTKIYERLKEGDAAKFFQLLSSKNISLISKEEAPDSDVTEEMARSFFLKREKASQ
ncbi:unnamed protein product [Miscanthus lutarioriparius]|uniref:ATP-dependent DNA helicase 2 subunit KU80 n=1 Tax=Miscanthus lutarioriparius TaxID=422564 RepID=A0A811RYR7_9POAL|nr:unnamed protein product [Miscanthus lutarioriparius]